MNAGQFDVLHDGGNEGVTAVRNCIGFHLKRIFQEFVDHNRQIGPNRQSAFDIQCQVFPVVNNFHTAAGWDATVAKMRGLMGLLELPPITDREADAIAGYLRERGAR